MSETMINLMIVFIAVACVFGVAWNDYERKE